MKKTVLTLLAIAAASSLQAAGVYGSLTVDGAPPRAEMKIQLVCNRTVIAIGTVDTHGSFSFGSPRAAVAPCTLSVGGTETPIIIFPSPTRYTLALTHPGGNARLVTR